MENEFGKFIEKLRGKESLRDVADRSGLSHAYIRDLELGINRKTKVPIKPSYVSLNSLAKAYNHPISDLVKKAGYYEGSGNEEELDIRKEFLKDLVGKVKGDDKIDLALALMEQIVKYSQEKTP